MLSTVQSSNRIKETKKKDMITLYILQEARKHNTKIMSKAIKSANTHETNNRRCISERNQGN